MEKNMLLGDAKMRPTTEGYSGVTEPSMENSQKVKYMRPAAQPEALSSTPNPGSVPSEGFWC